MEVIHGHGWRTLALRGLAGVLFGLIAFLSPAITLAALTVLFGAYSLADGLFALVLIAQWPVRRHVWVVAVEGIVGVLAGLAAFLWTGATALMLVRLVAIWAILTGALEIVAALHLRQKLPGELLLGLGGAASILLGGVVLSWPHTGSLMLVALLGCYSVFFGTALLVLSFRLRSVTLSRSEWAQHPSSRPGAH